MYPQFQNAVETLLRLFMEKSGQIPYKTVSRHFFIHIHILNIILELQCPGAFIRINTVGLS